MSEKYEAATGLSYQDGGEWKTAAKGDPVELDEAVAEDALARGIVKPARSTAKRSAGSSSAKAVPHDDDVPK